MNKFKLSVISAALLTMGMQAQAANDLFSQTKNAENNSVQALKADVNKRSLFNINKGALKQSTKSLNIQLDDQLNIEFGRTKASMSKSGSMIWQGEVSSEFLSLNSNSDALTKQQNSAILVEREGTVTGSVRYEGKLYRIRSAGNGKHSVEQVNEDIFKDHADDYVEPASGTFDASAPVTTAANPVIDVLVVYTSKAASLSGNISALIDLAETETNNGYSTSGVNASINVVHSAQVNYTEHSNSATDLTRLAATNDGHMDEVHTMRDTYGADMVVLVHDTNGYCGQADAIYANASSAFAIVDYDCATGYYSFGHELGHLQGARHNPENDPTTSPFSYGHGYQDPNGNWRTVMAYNCSSGCTRQLFWSNPNRTYGGTATGTSSRSDNTRVLNETAATMAAFNSGGTPSEWTTVTKSNLSASTNEWIRYDAVIPAGATEVIVEMSGGSGDADLYVHSSSPTTDDYTCRPWLSGNTETCTISNPSSSSWSVGVHAYSSYSGATVTWKYK